MRNQNLNVNAIIVSREVIDDARRYIPQPTCPKSFPGNVKKERTLSIRPTANIIIVTAALIFTEIDCSINVVFGRISKRKIS